MALKKEFKPRAGHGSSWFRLHVPGCLPPAASQQVRAHPFNHHPGFTLSVFHGWGDFEGLKRKSVPDGCKEKSRHALGRQCRGAASLPRSRELTSLSRTARGGKNTTLVTVTFPNDCSPTHSGFALF